MKAMRNLIRVVCLLTFVFGSICLTSCSSNDDDNSENSNNGKSVNINGTDYPISDGDDIGTSLAGQRWGDEVNLWLQVNNKSGNTIVVESYQFTYTSSTDPQKGETISGKGLKVSDDDSNSCSYTSGSATVIGTTSSTVTVKFDHLAMKGNSKSYTFDGTVTFEYEYTND